MREVWSPPQTLVQERDPQLPGDLGWRDVTADVAAVQAEFDGRATAQPDLALWSSAVTFSAAPATGQFRLLLEEYEYISTTYALIEDNVIRQPGRLIDAETFEVDEALVG